MEENSNEDLAVLGSEFISWLHHAGFRTSEVSEVERLGKVEDFLRATRRLGKIAEACTPDVLVEDVFSSYGRQGT